MPDSPPIPYGYRAVTGQLQKGDGLWNGERFVKVRKGWPFIGTVEGIAIRKCEVVQEVLPAVETGGQPPCTTPEPVQTVATPVAAEMEWVE